MDASGGPPSDGVIRRGSTNTNTMAAPSRRCRNRMSVRVIIGAQSALILATCIIMSTYYLVQSMAAFPDTPSVVA